MEMYTCEMYTECRCARPSHFTCIKKGRKLRPFLI